MAKCSKDFQRIKQKLAEMVAWSSRPGSTFTSLNEGSLISAGAEYLQIHPTLIWVNIHRLESKAFSRSPHLKAEGEEPTPV